MTMLGKQERLNNLQSQVEVVYVKAGPTVYFFYALCRICDTYSLVLL